MFDEAGDRGLVAGGYGDVRARAEVVEMCAVDEMWLGEDDGGGPEGGG